MLSQTKMPTALITFCLASLGAELTAATFIASSNPDAGVRTLYLPPLGVLSSLAAAIAGLLAWPLVHKAWPADHSLRFVVYLYALTIGGTFITVKYADRGFFGPVVSFVIALIAATTLTRSRPPLAAN